MAFINLKRNKNVKETNFKMYKDGKHWVFASMFVLALGLGSAQVSQTQQVLADDSVAQQPGCRTKYKGRYRIGSQSKYRFNC
ncbi:KxYKxGKxW signal peptide domain-containing protein [Lacticaseibacillus zeae]|uniref:KxYKxGKxW signal peptide domain-containing protein n=1 Tax=Lacticaseibacillus zeae subsp. silagei TaxID=3068307 RepID=A0ABD7ZC27_LACZE|nr:MULTISPECIES: KxYKxGKxW signal peptide domain-containing protein [Lacticaseibacillus]MDE3316928.1 KxYKxGKxW signal peptide domain-containing protein [Lacticaseibacillus zeae]WLV84559.1 KxYKxGKxW signal peptide domain-containing protein [Lacticaseibacillus sp. NCIMB 15475]WLV87315.1 KxYKxGKxW signal peptide domain-containing protein [Lacticaseibacillus sp. NCIMB 15474]